MGKKRRKNPSDINYCCQLLYLITTTTTSKLCKKLVKESRDPTSESIITDVKNIRVNKSNSSNNDNNNYSLSLELRVALAEANRLSNESRLINEQKSQVLLEGLYNRSLSLT